MRKQALFVFAAITLNVAMLAGASAQSEYNNTKGGMSSGAKMSVAPNINRGVSSRGIPSGRLVSPKEIPGGKRMVTPGGIPASSVKGASAMPGNRIAAPTGPTTINTNLGPGGKGMGPPLGGRGGNGGYEPPGGNRGAGGYGRDGRGGDYRRPGYGAWGGAVPGILTGLPRGGSVPPDAVIDDPDFANNPPPGQQPPQRTTRRGPSNAPAPNELRLVPDEVVIEMPSATSPQQINALQIRHGLARIESQTFQLSGTTLYRWRIPDRRSVAAVVRELEGDAVVGSVQPNYLFSLQQSEPKAASDTPTAEGDPAQYELGKLRLPQAHRVSKGDNVLVAVIDSGIDVSYPDLSGSIAESFDAITPDAAVPVMPGTPVPPHKHGTAIAGLIAAHGRLMGAAPNARIIAIRAFDPAGKSAEGSTFNILKGLDRAAASGARVINMSFAGPGDPAIHRSLEAARKKGIVLVAASGNEGAKSPPLYPAADPNVIAVSATDADDKLFEQSNRGSHIAVAAPGAQILVAIPDGGVEVSSGTSYSAAEVSGIVALMLARNPSLTPERVRDILLATAKDLGPKGRDVMFGAGLADAYGALTAEDVPAIASKQLPVERVSNGTR